MNKLQIIENAAMMLLAANGETTTLDVKNFIRANMPNLQIFQKEVSDHMILMQESGLYPDLKYTSTTTKGTEHRLYYLASQNAVSQPQSQQPVNQYSSITVIPKYAIEYENIEYCATADKLAQIIKDKNLPFRYSESKDAFENLEDMNIWHLAAVFAKDLANCNDKFEKMTFLQSVTAKTLVLRYSEILDTNTNN